MNKLVILYLVLSLFFFSCGSISTIEIEDEREDKNICDCCDVEADLWDYPDVTEFPENFVYGYEHPDVINEFQIPENILYCMTTEKLLDLCLHIPFARIFFNSLNWNSMLYVRQNECIRYLNILLDYNGVREFYARKDAIYWLHRRYNEEIQYYLENGRRFETVDLYAEDEAYQAFLENLLRNGGIKLDPSHDFIKYDPDHSNLPPLEIMLIGVEWQDYDYLKEILRSLVEGYEAVLSKRLSSLDNFGKNNTKMILFYNYWARANIIGKICDRCLDPSLHYSMPFLEVINDRNFTYWVLSDKDIDLIDQLSYQLIE